jgi:hypothetical protein
MYTNRFFIMALLMTLFYSKANDKLEFSIVVIAMFVIYSLSAIADELHNINKHLSKK